MSLCLHCAFLFVAWVDRALRARLIEKQPGGGAARPTVRAQDVPAHPWDVEPERHESLAAVEVPLRPHAWLPALGRLAIR